MAHKPVTASKGPRATSVLDPVEWERRVAEARARRERILAMRQPNSQEMSELPSPTIAPEPDPSPDAVTDPDHAGIAPPASPLPVSSTDEPTIRPVSGKRMWHDRRFRLAVVFATGLGAGLVLAFSLPVATRSPETPDSQTLAAGPAPGEDPGFRSAAADLPPAAPIAAPGNPPSAERPSGATPQLSGLAHQTGATDDPAAEPSTLATPLTNADPSDISGMSAAGPPPDQDTTSAEPSVLRPPARATGTEAGAAELDAPPQTATPESTRVVIHAPTGLPASRVQSIIADLRAAGFVPQGPSKVGINVQTTNARFFRDEDGARADAVRKVLPGPTEIRDFTHLSARPRPGTIELWLAGAASTASAPAPPPTTPIAQTPVTTTAPQAATGLVDAATIRDLVEAARSD